MLGINRKSIENSFAIVSSPAIPLLAGQHLSRRGRQAMRPQRCFKRDRRPSRPTSWTHPPRATAPARYAVTILCFIADSFTLAGVAGGCDTWGISDLVLASWQQHRARGILKSSCELPAVCSHTTITRTLHHKVLCPSKILVASYDEE